ncbi:MAG: peptide deformylase [Candidatus Paracaedibacteraceae bacterium]|nr:peptide deformylase [Candidatus Paracaedibacteraceae bacterium]
MANDETAHHSNTITLPPAVVEQASFNIDTLEVVNFFLSSRDREVLKELIKQPVIYNADENKESDAHVQLHNPAPLLQFPLNEAARMDILKLLAAFLVTPNCAGLAACQIGINRSALIYRIEEDAKDLRQDFTRSVPITLLLNPHYKALTDKKKTDWEGCFSVESTMGEIDRFERIKVTAYNSDGHPLEFKATGFEARLIQHETDHTHGILFIHRLQDHNRRGSYDEMRPLRKADIEKWKNSN